MNTGCLVTFQTVPENSAFNIAVVRGAYQAESISFASLTGKPLVIVLDAEEMTLTQIEESLSQINMEISKLLSDSTTSDELRYILDHTVTSTNYDYQSKGVIDIKRIIDHFAKCQLEQNIPVQAPPSMPDSIRVHIGSEHKAFLPDFYKEIISHVPVNDLGINAEASSISMIKIANLKMYEEDLGNIKVACVLADTNDVTSDTLLATLEVINSFEATCEKEGVKVYSNLVVCGESGDRIAIQGGDVFMFQTLRALEERAKENEQ